MSASLPPAPLRYQPAYEQPEPDEAETTQGLIDALLEIQDTTFKNSGTPLRSVHAKSHGIVQGTLTVLDNLPEPLAQGLFAKPGSHPVVMRFSTNAGDILDDSISLPRGMAMKVLGVEGERLPDAAGDTQDFVMVNAPAFAAPNAKKFLANLKMLAKTTDTPQILKKVASTVLRGTEAVVEAFGGESGALKTLGGHPNTHPLGETFYTQVPVLYGPYMAKLSVAPVDPALTGLKDQHISTGGRPDALREEMRDFFTGHGGEWEVRVQLCTDLNAMPIEDASVPWPEDKSPYIAVARIKVEPQTGWSEARSKAVDDGYSFSPWHGLAAHRPLGSIMRVRKATYEASTQARARHGGCPIHEPRATPHLPA